MVASMLRAFHLSSEEKYGTASAQVRRLAVAKAANLSLVSMVGPCRNGHPSRRVLKRRLSQDGTASVLDVRDAGRNVARGHVARSVVDVPGLVVEEEIGLELAQELALGEAAEEHRLVDADVPRHQGAD